METNAPAGGGELAVAPQPVRIKTGISDGASTEVTDGLKEGDTVVIGVKLTASQAAAAPSGQSPFGGGSFRRGF
jgi:multidrug efflux pump subunit AcrA (membrane-fusion protein)